MKKSLTCIICPIGCGITITSENGKITNIEGNTCPRGAEYAKNEFTNPTRTVTSTILNSRGIPIPVKTDRPIPKDKIFDCMKEIHNTVIDTPVKIGDIVIKNLFGSNIIVSGEIE